MLLQQMEHLRFQRNNTFSIITKYWYLLKMFNLQLSLITLHFINLNQILQNCKYENILFMFIAITVSNYKQAIK
jgi:hypothetical protein